MNGSKRRFFILDEPCPANLIESMVGRVVSTPRSPHADLSESTGKVPGDIVPGIQPEPTIFRNVALQLTGEAEAGVSTTASSLLDAHFSTRKTQSVTVKARTMKRYALAGLDDRKTRRYFELLMSDKGYAREVKRLMADSGRSEVYFVVGLLTAEGTVWSHSMDLRKEVSVKAEVPVGALAGLSLDVGVGAGPSFAGGSGMAISYEVEEEQVFAVAYDVIKKVAVFDKQAPMYVGSRVAHKGGLKPRVQHLALGDNDDSGSDSEDDAKEKELDEDSWEIAIQGALVEVED